MPSASDIYTRKGSHFSSRTYERVMLCVSHCWENIVDGTVSSVTEEIAWTHKYTLCVGGDLNMAMSAGYDDFRMKVSL